MLPRQNEGVWVPTVLRSIRPRQFRMKLGSHLTAGYDFATAYAASKFGLEG